MADQTPILNMPYILPSQAQKHVTHNEALEVLDAIVQISVLSRVVSTPPGVPAESDRYLVGPAPTGAWSGHAEKIAVSRPGGWALIVPLEGWIAWVADEDRLVVFDGAGWADLVADALNPATLVGVGATADATNRLSVASPASLFSHDGDDHRLKINKAAAGDTASVLFQSGFSGRAEFGLAGEDDFSVKVSPDGSAWTQALAVDAATGLATVAGDPTDDLGIATRRYAMARQGDTMTGVLRVHGVAHAPVAGPTGTVAHFSNEGATTRILYDNYASAAGGVNVTFRKARGTAASPSAIVAGDQIMNMAAFGHGATGYGTGTRGGFIVNATQTWTDTAQGTEMYFYACTAGTLTNTVMIRLIDGHVRLGETAVVDLQMGGSNTVISAERHFVLRPYAVASLPAATPAGQMIYVSDGSSNRRLAVSDGTNWRFPDGAVVS